MHSMRSRLNKHQRNVLIRSLSMLHKFSQVLSKYKQQRKTFVEALCTKEAELGCIVKLFVLSYTCMLKQYSKGRKFALFEQAWLLHIEDYFVETS